MTKYICSLIVSIFVAVVPALAVTMQSTPGALQNAVSDPASVTELVVTGTIDASDLFYIGSELTSLKSLDLTDATIEAYSGRRLGNLTAYPANTIPASCMAGSSIAAITFPATGSITIGDAALAGAQIATLVLPENIIAVGDGAFAACPALAGVVIKGSPALGTGVFSGCSALLTVTFDADMALPAHTFANCSALAAVNGSTHVTEIGDGAFSHCSALATFKVGNDLQSVGSEAFRASGLKLIDLSASRVAAVGSWAFADCLNLTTAHLDDISSMGEGIFFDCPELQTLTIGGVLEAVPDYAYTKSSNVDVAESVPESVRTIGAYALSGNNASAVTLPQGLDSIGDHGMERMANLAELNVYNNKVPALGKQVWDGVNTGDVTLNVLTGMQPEFMAADQWRNFHIIGVSNSIDAVGDTATTQLQVMLADGTLHVRSTGADIDRIDICDPAGIVLRSLSPRAAEASAYVGDITSKILIIAARLADDTAAAIKIAR